MPQQPPIDPALRLQPDQRDLTPAQEAAAQRFAAERTQAQLSTEPADKPADTAEVEHLLRLAYAAAGLPPPAHTQWVDGPLQLIEALALHIVAAGAAASAVERVQERLRERIGAHVLVTVEDNVVERVGDRLW